MTPIINALKREKNLNTKQILKNILGEIKMLPVIDEPVGTKMEVWESAAHHTLYLYYEIHSTWSSHLFFFYQYSAIFIEWKQQQKIAVNFGTVTVNGISVHFNGEYWLGIHATCVTSLVTAPIQLISQDTAVLLISLLQWPTVALQQST